MLRLLCLISVAVLGTCNRRIVGRDKALSLEASATINRSKAINPAHKPLPFARKGADGAVVKYDVVREGSFVLQREPSKGPGQVTQPSSLRSRPYYLVLTKEHLYAFMARDLETGWQKSRDPTWSEDAALDTATLEMDRDADGGTSGVASISGCSDDSCKGERQDWLVWMGAEGEVEAWQKSVDDLYLERNRIQERLAPMIARATEEAQNLQSRMQLQRHDDMPQSFSPLLLIDELVQDGLTQADMKTPPFLQEVVDSFAKGVTAFRPGDNSRSGAAFFFSANRAFIAKRVRPYELQSIWQATRDGQYKRRMEAGESLLNPVYLGFVNGGASWIVMRTEGLPAEVKQLLPSVEPEPLFMKKTSFFMDLKPKPMVSDRAKMGQLLLQTRALTRLTLSKLRSWGSLMEMVENDAKFLEQNDLVDYSLLVHGVFFQANAENFRPWYEDMQAAVAQKPGCSFGCPAPVAGQDSTIEQRFLDVTDRMLRLGVKPLTVGMSTYKCCCRTMGASESRIIADPCLLVKTNAKPGESFMKAGECIDLMGPRWHNFHEATELPVTNGRCLLRYGGRLPNTTWLPEDHPGYDKPPERVMPSHIGPEEAFGIKTPTPKSITCTVVCVSILDYLLPMNAWNTIENALLLPVYGSLKWSDYREKVTKLLECLASAQMKNEGDCDYFDSFIDKFRSDWPKADQTFLDHLVVKEPKSALSLGDAENCTADSTIYPKQCTVIPGSDGEGFEWHAQLTASKCRGNVIVMQLNPHHPEMTVALRVMDTTDLLTGWFAVRDEIDDDWVQFYYGFRIKSGWEGDGGPADFSRTVTVEHGEGPVNFWLLGGDGHSRVLDRTERLTLALRSQESKEEITGAFAGIQAPGSLTPRKEKASGLYYMQMIEPTVEAGGLFSLWTKKRVYHEPRHGTMPFLSLDRVRQCTQNEEVQAGPEQGAFKRSDGKFYSDV